MLCACTCLFVLVNVCIMCITKMCVIFARVCKPSCVVNIIYPRQKQEIFLMNGFMEIGVIIDGFTGF